MKKRTISFIMILALMFCMFVLQADAATAKFSRSSITLYAMQTYRLTLSQTVSGAKFSSSNDKVATIDDEGVITAISSGKAEVYVGVGTKIHSKCVVNVVTGNPPTDISLSDRALTMTEGGKEKIKATILPDDATDKSVHYFSSDTSVVKVDQNGNVTAVKAGMAVITAEASSSAVSQNCVVKVLPKGEKTNTKVNINGVLYSIAGERKSDMRVELKNKKDTVEATTDENGKFYFDNVMNGSYDINIYRKSTDTVPMSSAEFTVFTYDMNVSCIINGKELVVLYQEEKVSSDNITDIILEKTSLEIYSGETYDMNCKVRPENVGTPTLRGVSSDTDVVTVDSDGRITGVAGGKAKVTFSTLDGKISKSCMVVVTDANSNTYSIVIISAQVVILALIVLIFCLKYRKFTRNKELEEERKEFADEMQD